MWPNPQVNGKLQFLFVLSMSSMKNNESAKNISIKKGKDLILAAPG